MIVYVPRLKMTLQTKIVFAQKTPRQHYALVHLIKPVKTAYAKVIQQAMIAFACKQEVIQIIQIVSAFQILILLLAPVLLIQRVKTAVVGKIHRAMNVNAQKLNMIH